jgi:hypothetical protein
MSALFSNNAAVGGPVGGARVVGSGGGAAYGGALAEVDVSGAIAECFFVSNSAVANLRIVSNPEYPGSGNGGAMYKHGGRLSIDKTRFVDNVGIGGHGAGLSYLPVSGPGQGGAIFNESGPLEITTSALIGNQAQAYFYGGILDGDAGNGAGGAIYNLGELII